MEGDDDDENSIAESDKNRLKAWDKNRVECGGKGNEWESSDKAGQH